MTFYTVTKPVANNRVIGAILTAVMLTALILGVNTCSTRSLNRESTQNASGVTDTNAYVSEHAQNAPTRIKGMIDANAYHSNTATWPATLTYVYVSVANKKETIQIMNKATVMKKLTSVDGMNINRRQTTDLGNFLVKLNSRMYNEEITRNQTSLSDLDDLFQIKEDIKHLLNGRSRKDLKDKEELRRLDDLERKEKNLKADMADVYRIDIPSLIMAETMDMEFAHINGYDGEPIYRQDKETGRVFYERYRSCPNCPTFLSDDEELAFQNWKRQVSDVEAAAISNPLRLFPLFSYDPRRYRLSDTATATAKNGWGTWKEPFARIVGHGDSAKDVKKIWLGFSMNLTLGYRPFDELCDYLPMFYRECEKNNIPIIAHCVPGGITTHEATDYSCCDCELDTRENKNNERYKMILEKGLSSHQNDSLLSSSRYYGGEDVFDYEHYLRRPDNYFQVLDNFYMYYGHPRNWIPVLRFFPDLRLCLTGFGGNSEWRRAEWSSDSASVPTRQWLRVIIKLTAQHKNVYTDISGLDIYDEKIRDDLLELLKLIQDEKNDDFKHLKYKLIFGSGWYSTYLTDVSAGGKSVDGTDTVEYSYSNYCREFKKIFDKADKDGNGELWEYVSLFNPWKFYGLSKDKINKIHDELLIENDY